MIFIPLKNYTLYSVHFQNHGALYITFTDCFVCSRFMIYSAEGVWFHCIEIATRLYSGVLYEQFSVILVILPIFNVENTLKILSLEILVSIRGIHIIGLVICLVK